MVEWGGGLRRVGALRCRDDVFAAAPRAAPGSGRSKAGEVAGGYGDTFYELRRAAVWTGLRAGRVLAYLAIDDVTEDEVHDALDTD